jgi:hypothetical protein
MLKRELVVLVDVREDLRKQSGYAFVVGPVNHVVYSLLLIPSH